MVAENTITLNVRDEHRDEDYDHLNHGAYGIYYHQARRKLQDKYGLNDRALSSCGIGLVISEANYQFFEEVPVGSEIEITSRIRNVKKSNTRDGT